MRRDDRLAVGISVPGWSLPVVSTAVAVAAGSMIHAAAGWIIVMGVLCLLSGVARVLGGPWVSAVVLVIVLVASDAAPGRTAVVIAAVHLLHVLGSLAMAVPVGARVAVPALRSTAIRFAIMQAVGQAAGVLAFLLPQGRVLPAAVVLGALAVLGFVLGALRMLRAQRAHGYAASSEPSVGGPS
ncbi:hypothetical protein [Microbacterium arabinogalactanolyticum]|uniref:MFS transporter n=1 Tax=Microbacterium arabinogalactanolyticum TaxID=69365 RepID=A0ABQ5NDB2_9MICO|nr:hypothetical protein [Microbacterium arabinogalactanolyticum]GLC83666.1 hypothetical protein MIAR_02540 [Microbacterium arabinogalactanolyticum]